jgi:hypothetical protein
MLIRTAADGRPGVRTTQSFGRFQIYYLPNITVAGGRSPIGTRTLTARHADLRLAVRPARSPAYGDRIVTQLLHRSGAEDL